MSFLLETITGYFHSFSQCSTIRDFSGPHIGNGAGIKGLTTSGPGAMGFGEGFGSPSAGSGSGSGSFGAGSGGFRFIGRRSPFRILPIVLLGVMIPIGQILNVFLEFLFVHGKKLPAPCRI
jgi:hypothetical protein